MAISVVLVVGRIKTSESYKDFIRSVLIDRAIILPSNV
jgi:hypothetical protein